MTRRGCTAMRLGEEEESGGGRGRGVAGARWSGKDMMREGSPRPWAAPASDGQCNASNASVGCWRREAWGGGRRLVWSGLAGGRAPSLSPHLTALHRTTCRHAWRTARPLRAVRASEAAGEGMVMGSTLSGLAIRSHTTLAVDLGVGGRVPVLAGSLTWPPANRSLAPAAQPCP